MLLEHSARHNCSTDPLQQQGKCCWPPALAVSAPALPLQRRLPLCHYHCSTCSGPDRMATRQLTHYPHLNRHRAGQIKRLKAHDCISTEAGSRTCCRATQDSGWLCRACSGQGPRGQCAAGSTGEGRPQRGGSQGCTGHRSPGRPGPAGAPAGHSLRPPGQRAAAGL